MPIQFACAGCGKTLKASFEHAGQKVKCPGCHSHTSIPASVAPPVVTGKAIDNGDIQELRPIIDRNETNGLSNAEAERDRIYDLFERVAKSERVEILLLKSPPFTSPPWVRVECWVRNVKEPGMTIRSSAELHVRPREFHTFPLEIDMVVSDDKRKRTWKSIVSFENSDALEILRYLLCKRESHRFGLHRCRRWPFQIWLQKNKLERLGLDPLAILVQILIGLGVLTLGFGIGLLLLLAGGIAAYFSAKRRRHVLSAGKPSQEPRRLVRMDSWQALVDGLGRESEHVKAAINEQLTKALGEDLVLSDEEIWYWGVDGKEEREQLVIRFRRAIAFVHIYGYGDDLFVGWDAHVNCGSWSEEVAGGGYDKDTQELCVVHTITAGWHIPNEYDITDTNCLLERVHAVVTKVIKLKLAEHKIDQELDFTILREQRQNIAGRKERTSSDTTGGVRRAISNLRRVG